MMTTEELKQEAIKKAYGEYFEQCNPNESGWCTLNQYKEEIQIISNFDNPEISDMGLDLVGFRPKSLSGIENNRGWTRIEEDGSNLPSLGYYWVKNREDGEIYKSTIDPKRRLDMIEWFSHYQPIIKPELPLY